MTKEVKTKMYKVCNGWQDYQIDLPTGSTALRGEVIGTATSQNDLHKNHVVGESIPLGKTCSACRWIEISIFRLPPMSEHRFAVYTKGSSVLPGETTRSRLEYTSSAHAILELLADRRGLQPRLPKVAALAIAEAASYDRDVADAYVNRAYS